MEKKKKWGIMLMLLFSAIVMMNWKMLFIHPLQDVTVDTPYMVLNGTQDGSFFVSDQSGKRFYYVNAEGKVEFLMNGRRGGKDFYEAKQMYVASDGNIYILDISRVGGRRMDYERILKYDADGKLLGTVAEIQYKEDDLFYKNAINRMTQWNGKLVWFQFTEDGFDLMSEDGIEQSFPYHDAANLIVDFEINPATQGIVYLTKAGEIFEQQEDGNFVCIYSAAEKEGSWIPWYLNYDENGLLCYADLGQRAIFRIEKDGTLTTLLANSSTSVPEGISAEEIKAYPIYYNFDITNQLVTTDTYGILTARDGEEASYIMSVPLESSLRMQSLGVWCCLLAVAFGILNVFILLLRNIITGNSIYAKSVTGMLAGTIVLTGLFAMTIYGDWTEYMTQEMVGKTASVSALAAELIPGDSLKQIDGIEDYGSEAYKTVRDTARKMFVKTDKSMADLYCTIYRIQDGVITVAYSIEDYVGAVYPYDWPYEGSDEQIIMNEQIQMSYDDYVTSEGGFIFTNSPILDSEGNTVGIMEVGTDLYNFQQDNRTMIMGVVISAIAIAVTLILIVSELLIFIEGHGKRKKAIEQGTSKRVIPVSMLRILVFLIFFVTNMPKGFLPMYIMKQAETEPLFGLSPAFLISIALSAEVLFGAIFSVGGNVVLRFFGRRKTAILGSILFTGGLCMRAIVPTILFFIVGNAIMGAGWGLLLLIVQILIAEKEEDEKTEGFTGYTAASLSGVNCGVVFGAFLVNWMSHQMVLFVVGILSAVSLLFSYRYLFDGENDGKENNKTDTQEEVSEMTTLQFICSPQVLLYFAAGLVPVVAAGYFLAYLYPILGAEMGISEANVGYSYLLNGICIIFLGNMLTKMVTQKMSKKGALVSSVFLYAAAFLIYAINPSVITLLLTLILLGISDSYGLPMQSNYYTDLDEVRRYGYDRAMGVYSLLENMSQVFGSFIFGVIYTYGVKEGLILAGGVLLALAFLFLIFGNREKA